MAVRIPMALDLARCFGWCVGAVGGRPRYGSVELQGDQHGAIYLGLQGWLDDARAVHGFTEIVCEAPMISGDFRSRNSARLALGLAAHVQSWCWDNGMSHREEHVGTARKGVLGRGTFERGTSKGVVMDWARREGFKPADDNAADGVLLWAFVTGYRHQPALVGGAA